MKIYKLTPIDELNPSWRASDYTGIAIIRAKSEERAREMAGNAFKKWMERKPENVNIQQPWQFSDVVSVEIDVSSEHSAEGDECLIFPESHMYE